MRYLPDYDHSTGGRRYEEVVGSMLREIDGGTLYLEGVNSTRGEKHRRERVYNRVADGEATVMTADDVREAVEAGELTTPDEATAAALPDREGHFIVAEEEWFPLGPNLDGRAAELRAVEANREHVERIDTGPVHKGFSPRIREAAFELQWEIDPADRTPTERKLIAAASRLRDENWVEYIKEEMDEGTIDPDNSALVMGFWHHLDRRLAGVVDIERQDEVAPAFQGGEDVPRRVGIRNILSMMDVGGALHGDPEAVADEIGFDGVQARLAALGAGCALDERVTATAPGVIDEFGAAVEPPELDAPAERIAALQEDVRGLLSEVVDLEAAFDRGDVDTTVEETPADAVTTAADAIAVDDPPTEAVTDLLERPDTRSSRGEINPQELATAVETEQVRPLGSDRSVESLAAETRSEYRKHRGTTWGPLLSGIAGAAGAVRGAVTAWLPRSTASETEEALPDGDMELRPDRRVVETVAERHDRSTERTVDERTR